MAESTVAPDLSMPHLSQSVEDAKKAIEKRVGTRAAEAAAAQEAADADDPRTHEEFTFKFDYTDSQGKRWYGKFTNRAMTILMRQRRGVLQAQWQLGVAHSAYDPDTAFLNEILAHMAISLEPVEGSGAFSIDELRESHDMGVINTLYEEVLGHEARFHGHTPLASSGKKGNG